jgi:hypothetical protein
LGYYGGFSGFLSTYQAGYGAEVSAGSDYYSGAYLIVGDPLGGGASQALEGRAEKQAGFGAFQQIVVEFAAADAVTYWLAIIAFDGWAADAAYSQAGDGLEQVLACVFLRVDFQLF